MKLKSVRRLRGGETEELTQKYWEIRSKINSRDCSIDDVYRIWKKEELDRLNESELVYLYWELNYGQCKYNREAVDLMLILIKRVYNEIWIESEDK